jgi:hypothetical protein
MLLRVMRLRRRFLRKTRSEARAYPPVVCKRRTTASLRKKIKPTLAIQLHGYGSGYVGILPQPAVIIPRLNCKPHA